MTSFEVNVEFEVFCATCGAGLCNSSDTRNSFRRSIPQVTVEVCETCVENAKEPLEETIEELKETIKDLEMKIRDLEVENEEIPMNYV